MSNSPSIAVDISNLAENFDDLLEALSTLRLINELPAYKLTEMTLLKEALKILYQGCKTTNSTIYIWPKNCLPTDQSPENLQNVLAIDANGIVHQRFATPDENFFMTQAITERTSQQGADYHTLNNEYPCGALAMSIISVPIYDLGNLTGVITISHSARAHINQWWQQLMETFSKTLGHQITICRLQD